MKRRVNAVLLLLLSLCTVPMHAMQVENEVTPEIREAVDRFVANRDISQAILHGQHKKVEALLAKEADPNGTFFGPWNYTPHTDHLNLIKHHAHQDDYTVAYRGLTDFLALAEQDPDPIPLLHTAAQLVHVKMVEALLQYGADPDYHHNSQSALYSASAIGAYEVAQPLLGHGAAPNRLVDNPTPDSLMEKYPSPLDIVLHNIATDINGMPSIGRNIAKLLLAHGARAHGSALKDLPYHTLCALIWKTREEPDISDTEAHEKQRLFTLDHWNMRNPSQFILDRKLGLVPKPRCKCWEVEV